MTVRVGTLLRIPIRVHLLLPAMAVVVVVTTPRYTDAETFLALLSFFAVMAVSILAHELGHALVARGHRLEAHGITLWPLGGFTECDPPRNARSKVRVALAGVSVNFALALLAGAGLWLRDGVLPGLPGLRPEPGLLLTAWNLNLSLGILNLLPGLPFDGGMAVEGLLWRRLGRVRARGMNGSAGDAAVVVSSSTTERAATDSSSSSSTPAPASACTPPPPTAADQVAGASSGSGCAPSIHVPDGAGVRNASPTLAAATEMQRPYSASDSEAQRRGMSTATS